jgi:hypothetical protein
MLSRGWLVGDEVFGALLPDVCAYYHRPISRVLRNFLSRLPDSDVAHFLSAQAASSPSAPAEERFGALTEHCPALRTLEQILARDRRPSPKLSLHVQQTESLPSSTPIHLIRESLTRGPSYLARLGVEPERSALTEANSAIVVPSRSMRHQKQGGPE